MKLGAEAGFTLLWFIIISGLFGVGGGIVLVPAMVFILGTQVHQAIGTSLIVIVPTALIGAFKHYKLGNIDWPTAWALVPTAVIGGYMGAWLTSQIPADNLKRAFGGFLVLIGLRLVFGK